MNKSVFISILSVLIVLSGFTFFYFMKIKPDQDDIGYAKNNIHMYQETVANNQKKLAQQKKDLAEKKKLAKKEEEIGNKVNPSILPKNPDVEPFFSMAQKKAASMDITFKSIVKSKGASDNDSSTDGSSSSDTSSSEEASKKNAEKKTDTSDSLLTSNTYQVTLESSSDTKLYHFIDYLESQKRLIVINKVSSTRTNGTQVEDNSSSSANESSAKADSGDTHSTVQSNADGSNDQTSSADASSQIDAASAQADSSSVSTPTIEPSYQMTLTITIYSAKQ